MAIRPRPYGGDHWGCPAPLCFDLNLQSGHSQPPRGFRSWRCGSSWHNSYDCMPSQPDSTEDACTQARHGGGAPREAQNWFQEGDRETGRWVNTFVDGSVTRQCLKFRWPRLGKWLRASSACVGTEVWIPRLRRKS